MLTLKVRSIVIGRPEIHEIRVAAFARVRLLHAVVAGCTRRHCRNKLADEVFLSVEIRMAGFAFDIICLQHVLLMGKDQLAIDCGEFLIRCWVVAGVAKGALLVQLFFVAGLAIRFGAEEIVRRKRTSKSSVVAFHALDSRTCHVRFVNELEPAGLTLHLRRA